MNEYRHICCQNVSWRPPALGLRYMLSQPSTASTTTSTPAWTSTAMCQVPRSRGNRRLSHSTGGVAAVHTGMMPSVTQNQPGRGAISPDWVRRYSDSALASATAVHTVPVIARPRSWDARRGDMAGHRAWLLRSPRTSVMSRRHDPASTCAVVAGCSQLPGLRSELRFLAGQWLGAALRCGSAATACDGRFRRETTWRSTGRSAHDAWMKPFAHMLCLTVLVACAPGQPEVRATSSASGTTGIDLAGMDTSVAPGNDFYGYANGGWIKGHEIPPDRSSYGTGTMVQELTAKRTAELVAEAAKDAAPGSDARKIGDYYAAYLDEAAIAARGLAPLQPALERITGISDGRTLARALGAGLRADVDVLNNTNYDTDNLFGLWVAQDLSDPARYSAFLLQGGLGLPDRDYYLDAAPRMAEIRDRYRAHIAAVFTLAGLAEADARAARVFELEHKIAEAHRPRLETEDVTKGNNHWTRAELAERAPGLDWQSFLAAAGLDRQAGFVIWQPGAATALAALVASQPLDAWKDWMTYHAIARRSDVLPQAFDDESFAFYGKALTGTQQKRERWKRAIDATSGALGEAVGRLYVARYFPASEKARVEAMVKNEIAAFARRIDRLDWMTPATKAKAKAKLAVRSEERRV